MPSKPSKYYPRRIYSILHAEHLEVDIQPNMKRVWESLSNKGAVYLVTGKITDIKHDLKNQIPAPKERLFTYDVFCKRLRKCNNRMCVQVWEGDGVKGHYFVEQQLVV